MQLQLEINQQLLEEAQGLEAGSDLDLQMLIENALREYIDQHALQAQVILSDKKKLQAEMVQLLHSLGVDATRKAMPIEQVQQKMHEAGLGPYTLSEAIVAAREE